MDGAGELTGARYVLFKHLLRIHISSSVSFLIDAMLPTSVVDRRQAWGDGGSPYTSSIIVLTCTSGLEPDLAKLTNAGLDGVFLLRAAEVQAKAIRRCTFFNAVAMQTVNRTERNAKTLKLQAGVAKAH